MKCPMQSRENAELLLAYCARRLDPETETVLERHMGACPECREFQRSQELVWNALDSWEAMPASADFNRRLYARIAEEEARASCWSRILRPVRPILAGPAMSRGLPAAAAICLLVLAGIILQNPGGVILPEEVTADARIESIQPDQVERMLDEIEMLRQLRITPAGDGSAVNAM